MPATAGCYVPAMASDVAGLLVDLRAESDDLDRLVGDGSAETLTTPTPADGWTIGDTVGHLWFFDREARKALERPADFVAGLEALAADVEGYLERHIAEIRDLGEALLPSWRAERTRLIEALRVTDPATRVPWYGPPMSPMSFGTARLMETWAHGQDIADALGVKREPTDRLRHIAHLGVRTRGFSYAVKGREAPDVPVFVALTSPAGEQWTWGEPEAADRISGTALDFCLVVTQRRVVADTDLSLDGAAAREWMSIAQAFAGGPTTTDESRRGL
jgi:uncharacterized protein (TIGR03084 family)